MGFSEHHWNEQEVRQRLEAAAAYALDRCKAQGCSASQVGVHADLAWTVSSHQAQMENLEFHRSQSLALQVYFGQQTGSASTTDLSERALADCVEAACAMARFAASDPCQGLPLAEELARDIPDLKLSERPQPSIEEGCAWVMASDQAAKSQPSIDHAESSLSSERSLSLLANSLGFCESVASTRTQASTSATAKNASGMERDYDYAVARSFSGIPSPETVALHASERAARRLGARSRASGRYPIILEARVARSFWRLLLKAMGGGAIYRKSSFLLDRLGQQVLSPGFRVFEDPLIPGGLYSGAFDAEGVPTVARDLVDVQGRLCTYLLGTYSARKLSMKTTGHASGTHNVFILPETPAVSVEDLIAPIESGFWVTELLGHGVNLVTGDYSQGAAGFWIEKGVITHPVNEMTIAGNLREMFQMIEVMAEDIDLRGNIQTGSIRLQPLSVAGSS